MNIEFINHSSFILEQDNLRIMCDPWVEGKAFAESWSLITKTQFKYVKTHFTLNIRGN
jgi:L-ascorbate metabolism protein UlaG (beta-lactamase superfamily)